jgi:NAD(P)-dependent dehydrogenase (short-subunit alcohol dehydrogenase family)
LFAHDKTIAFRQLIGNADDLLSGPSDNPIIGRANMEIRDTSVLITGGSRGLGRALGKAMAREGARVTLVARDREHLDKTLYEIRALGGEVHAIAADVGDKAAVYPIAGQSAALAGPIDILVLNASTLGPVPLRLLMDTECEDLEQVLQVNLIGPFRLAKAVAGAMALRGRGLVIAISSDAAIEAYPGWGPYGVSKAALDHMMRIFAKEFEGTDIQFLSIDPGEMDTRMHADAMPDADPATLAKPEDVAERICEIIRHAADFETGSRVLASHVEVS